MIKKAQSLVEYVLVAAVIIAALLAFVLNIGTGIQSGLDNANRAMTNATAKLGNLLAD